MSFNSLTFGVFFVVVLGIYRAMTNWRRQKYLLIVASYVFYAAWNPPFVVLLLFSTILDWWLARRIAASGTPAGRRGLLVASLVSNLGLLGFFKYGAFLLDNFSRLLALAGVTYTPPALDIVLPVGISFYTFQSLSYTLDVYRRRIRSDWSFSDYTLFVSFFPQLVAGPIVRASEFLPQLTTPRRASADQTGWGLNLLVLGLFYKVVLADSIFAPVVDTVYGAPSKHGAVDTLAAVLGFSGQIYYDFAGYSLCAIGAALCFGFVLPDNFRYPYAAIGFSDFWRRWHISLSSWLKDYLYIPLGGNRCGDAATYRNLMLTMLIGGLWHGASWMFVIWGGLHGLYLALERMRRKRLGDVPEKRGVIGLATAFLTFAVVTLTWIPFRSPDAQTAVSVIAGLFVGSQPPLLTEPQLTLCFLAMAGTFVVEYALRDSSPEDAFQSLSLAIQPLMLGSMMIAIFLCSGGDERAFIYFQF